MSEYFDTHSFEELGITASPYIEEYKKVKGVYPILAVQKATKLPTRYKASDGELKFHMKTIYHPHQEFRVKGTEPGKRSPEAVNVILAHPTDPDSEIVITPADMIKKMAVIDPTSRRKVKDPFDETEEFDSEIEKEEDPLASIPKAVHSESVKSILEKRKKEAAVSI